MLTSRGTYILALFPDLTGKTAGFTYLISPVLVEGRADLEESTSDDLFYHNVLPQVNPIEYLPTRYIKALRVGRFNKLQGEYRSYFRLSSVFDNLLAKPVNDLSFYSGGNSDMSQTVISIYNQKSKKLTLLENCVDEFFDRLASTIVQYAEVKDNEEYRDATAEQEDLLELANASLGEMKLQKNNSPKPLVLFNRNRQTTKPANLVAERNDQLSGLFSLKTLKHLDLTFFIGVDVIDRDYLVNRRLEVNFVEIQPIGNDICNLTQEEIIKKYFNNPDIPVVSLSDFYKPQPKDQVEELDKRLNLLRQAMFTSDDSWWLTKNIPEVLDKNTRIVPRPKSQELTKKYNVKYRILFSTPAVFTRYHGFYSNPLAKRIPVIKTYHIRHRFPLIFDNPLLLSIFYWNYQTFANTIVSSHALDHLGSDFLTLKLYVRNYINTVMMNNHLHQHHTDYSSYSTTAYRQYPQYKLIFM